MEKLKPCPWCGCKPKIGIEPMYDEYWVSCRAIKCDVNAQTSIHRTKEAAIKAWNTRKEAA